MNNTKFKKQIQKNTPYFSIISYIDILDDLFIKMAQSIFSQSICSYEWFIVVTNNHLKKQIENILREQKVSASVCIYTEATHSSLPIPIFEKTTGRLLCFCNHSNVLEVTYFEKSMWFLESNPQIPFCNAQQSCPYSHEIHHQHHLDNKLQYITHNSQVGRGIIIHRHVILHAIQKAVAKKEQQVQFQNIFLEIASNGFWGGTIPEKLHLYPASKNTIPNKNTCNTVRKTYPYLFQNFPNTHLKIPQAYETLKTQYPIQQQIKNKNEGQSRYLFILPWMVMGGADKFNYDLIESLVCHHHVSICTTFNGDSPWEQKFKALTDDIFILKNFLNTSDTPRFLSYIIESRRINFVIISGSSIAYQLLPYLRVFSPDTTFIDLTHVEEPQWKNGGHPRFSVGYQDLLDANIVSTQHLASWMEKNKADSSKIHVLRTGVKLHSPTYIHNTRKKAQKNLKINHETPVIIFSGRICQQKRPALLAQILKELNNNRVMFHALIIGDGEQYPLLKKLINTYHLNEKTTMLGAIPHQNWLELLTCADIFLLPSQYEGISIALLEAMSMGVIPVVSNVGGQSEIVRQEAGYLIPQTHDEVSQYVQILTTLLENKNQRQLMKNEARKLIELFFSKENLLQEFNRIILSASKSHLAKNRLRITKKLAIEFATSSLELQRVEHALHYSWTQLNQNKHTQNDFASIIHILIKFRKSKIGLWLAKRSSLRKIIQYIRKIIK